MRILVLAHANKTAGGKSVALQLLGALARLNHETEIIPVLPVGCGYEDFVAAVALCPIWFRQNGSVLKRSAFDSVILPRHARSVKPDAILALGNVGLSNSSVPQAILIHDAHYVYPKRHYGQMSAMETTRYALQGRQIVRSVSRSAVVYCQTQTMCRRVRQKFGRVDGVRLLPNCLPNVLLAAPCDTSLPERLNGYGGHFRLICLTRYYSHKNLEMIVETFRRHSNDLKDVVAFLTVPPDQGREANRLLTTVRRFRLEDRIINLGYIEQSEIPAYFGHCHALLFPTLLESFSTTYLEAMHCGLPILTSDLDFAHEVCGPAALYFDPWSPDSIAQAILRLRLDEPLRHNLATAGRQRLARVHNHSWDDTAATIVSDLRDIVGSAG